MPMWKSSTPPGRMIICAIVISDSFKGKSMVQQHQVVYKALGRFMTNEIHAMQLKTLTKEQWENERQ